MRNCQFEQEQCSARAHELASALKRRYVVRGWRLGTTWVYMLAREGSELDRSILKQRQS